MTETSVGQVLHTLMGYSCMVNPGKSPLIGAFHLSSSQRGLAHLYYLCQSPIIPDIAQVKCRHPWTHYAMGVELELYFHGGISPMVGKSSRESSLSC